MAKWLTPKKNLLLKKAKRSATAVRCYQCISDIANRASEVQQNHEVCQAKRGGLRTPSKISNANLDCVYVKKPHTFYTDP